MTGENSTLFQKTGTTRHFLFSKTDTSQLGAKLRQRHENNKIALTAVFPKIQSGENFIGHALEILASQNKIGAMVIRVDDISPSGVVNENHDRSDLYVKVAETLNGFCQLQQGLWGLIDPCLFGCFVPGKNDLEIQTLADDFRNAAKKIDSVTVSIGTATYPTLDYKKTHILANAKKAIDHAAFFGPDNSVAFDAVSLNISGDQYYERGDIKGAIEEFQQALRIDASNINVHNSLGVCFGVLGEYEKAIESFQAVIESDDGEHMALYNLGFVHLLQGNREKALENFLKANETYSDVFEIVLQTGKLYLDMDNPENGKNYLEQAAHLNPESSIVHRYLGDSYTALKSQDEAIIAYKKAVKYNPSDAASLSALGCLFDEKGENPEIALMFCHESVKLAPENGLLRHRLGKLYLKQNQLENAFKEFRKADFLGYDASQEINETQELIKAKADKEELAKREAS